MMILLLNIPDNPITFINQIFTKSNAPGYFTQNIESILTDNNFRIEILIDLLTRYAESEEITLEYMLKENIESFLEATRTINITTYYQYIFLHLFNKYQAIKQELHSLVCQSDGARAGGLSELYIFTTIQPQIVACEKKLKSFLKTLSILCAYVPPEPEYINLFLAFYPQDLAQIHNHEIYWEIFFKNNNPVQAHFMMDTLFFNFKSHYRSMEPISHSLLGLLVKSNSDWAPEQQQIFFEKYFEELFLDKSSQIENNTLVSLLTRSLICGTSKITDICANIILYRAISFEGDDFAEIIELLLRYCMLEKAELFILHLKMMELLSEQQTILFINTLFALFYNSAFTKSKNLVRLANHMLYEQLSFLPANSDTWKHCAPHFLWNSIGLVKNPRLCAAVLDKLDSSVTFERLSENKISSFLLGMLMDSKMNCVFERLISQSPETGTPTYPNFQHLVQEKQFLTRVFRHYLELIEKNELIARVIRAEFFRNNFEFLAPVLRGAVISERSLFYLFNRSTLPEQKHSIKNFLQREAMHHISSHDNQQNKLLIFEMNCTLIADICFTAVELNEMQLQPQYTEFVSCYRKGVEVLAEKQKNQDQCPALRVLQEWIEANKLECAMVAEYAAIHCQTPKLFFNRHSSLLTKTNKKRPIDAYSEPAKRRALTKI